MYHDKEICTRLGRIAALWVLLACFLFPLAAQVNAQRASTQVHAVNLFLLPLEEVLSIDVRAGDGAYVVSRRMLTRLLRDKASAHYAARDVSANNGSVTLRALQRKLASGAAQSHKQDDPARAWALSIDGWQLGIVAEANLRTYLAHRGLNLERLEVYLGESAFWWSDGGSDRAINLVTRSREGYAPSQDTFTQEEGQKP